MAEPAYTVRRSDRARRARLTVTRDGEAVVVLPRRAPASLAPQLVALHAEWLARQIVRIRAANDRVSGRPTLAAGRALHVHGTPYRVVLVPAARGHGRVIVQPAADGQPATLEVRSVANGAAPMGTLEAWLRAEARRVLLERVAALAPVVGVPLPAVTIRGQRSRWGSASRRGSLSLNWRLILAPPAVLEYVVVHELAHLRVTGHSARFWTLVRRHAPHVDTARAWLREHHAELMAALDDDGVTSGGTAEGVDPSGVVDAD